MSISAIKNDEHILVVPREYFFPHGDAWHGLKYTDIDTYIAIIQKHKTFIPRSHAEIDPTYKQVIPYLVFIHHDTVFVMQRRSNASEARLRNKYSIGIGGHIRQEDMLNGTTIFDWAQREFHEEVFYSDPMSISTLGILNDDSDHVGKVHIGLVLLVNGTSPTIRVRSELKSAELLSLDQTLLYKKDNMESWSVIILQELLNRKMINDNPQVCNLFYQ